MWDNVLFCLMIISVVAIDCFGLYMNKVGISYIQECKFICSRISPSLLYTGRELWLNLRGYLDTDKGWIKQIIQDEEFLQSLFGLFLQNVPSYEDDNEKSVYMQTSVYFSLIERANSVFAPLCIIIGYLLFTISLFITVAVDCGLLYIPHIIAFIIIIKDSRTCIHETFVIKNFDDLGLSTDDKDDLVVMMTMVEDRFYKPYHKLLNMNIIVISISLILSSCLFLNII